jgi:hypothetical protein
VRYLWLRCDDWFGWLPGERLVVLLVELTGSSYQRLQLLL